MTSALLINNLTKKYHNSNFLALDDVNLKVKKGSFFGLLGPNGAGKSTMINIISSIISKDSGEIKICGKDLDKNNKEAKVKIGIVPQELIIDPFFTVYETLELYAGYYGVRKKNRQTNEILLALGLNDKRNQKPRMLSGGMRRRLLIAKALVHSPELLILDEPTAGVDVELRQQLWSYIKKLNKSGTTIILTTHYLEEAEELCDEIAFLDKGKIINQGKKSEILKLIENRSLLVTSDKNLPLNLNFKNLDFFINNNQITINYKAGLISVEDIIDQLKFAKITIKDISTTQPNLEDIFKYLYNEK